MALFGRRKANEEMLRVKMKPIPDDNNSIGISSADADITAQQLESSDPLINADEVDKFTTLSMYLDERYAAYEEMLKDPVVAAAVEMYADDSTQINRDGEVIWVESDDPTIAEAGNRLIRVLNLNKTTWRNIYSLVTYGDLYLRLYKEGDRSDDEEREDDNGSSVNIMAIKPDDKNRQLQERVEYVNNPAGVFDLQDKDKTTGFIRLKLTPTNDMTTLVSHDKIGGFNQPVSTVEAGSFTMLHNKSYVHVTLSESIERFPQLLALKNAEGETSAVYEIKSGKSILEDAYTATRQLELLKDSLMMNRLTKSALVRLMQVEIGDTPKPDAEGIMHRVKRLFEQKMSLNRNNGYARSYNNPGPVENTVYVPTRNGIGAVTQTTIGGDVDVKGIADIDYFQGQQLAALKIPKQFLNFDSPEGLGNGTQLTKVSSRYAHTVIRIQNAYCQGITTLLNIFFMDKGLDYVNKFSVRMVSPSTVEDTDRDEQLSNTINTASDLMNLYSDFEPSARCRILKAITDELIPLQSVKDAIKDAKFEGEESEVEPGGGGGGFNPTSDEPDLSDIDFGEDEIPELDTKDEVSDFAADAIEDEIGES